ncbi:MAG: metalloregulator ArsR/SmtB family transcription factor [Pseudomonadota bacterium]
MIQTVPSDLQGTFRALADPSRREMLTRLRDGEMTIGDMAEHFPMTRAAVKKHLTILEQGNLISVHARGRERINRLEPLALKEVSGWLDYFSNFWDDKLTKLHTAVEAAEGNSK